MAFLTQKGLSMFKKITDHVYWMTPDKPDRPSLAAVVGEKHTLMLDAGASANHARLFLDALAGEGVRAPDLTALTHWHWDHVFGALEIGAPLIAHSRTAEKLKMLAGYDWSDAALDQQASDEIKGWAENIKLELSEPRHVEIVQPEIIYRDSLDIQLGGLIVQLQYVGGDHAADSCVAYIEADRVLFLGDCLYPGPPTRHYTTRRLFGLLDKLETFDTQFFIEGHNPDLMDHAEFEAMAAKMRAAGLLVNKIGKNERAVFSAARATQTVDEDMEDFLRAFIAGV
jgi:glyoxylase-like metal-dependent hydrolase (beta-lactamase superfamily II)